MIVRVIHIYVKQDSVDEFVKATIQNHKASILESGVLRFDVLRDSDDPLHFLLYEAYHSVEATESHKLTPHYAEWKKSVEQLMSKDRERTEYHVVAPEIETAWSTVSS